MQMPRKSVLVAAGAALLTIAIYYPSLDGLYLIDDEANIFKAYPPDEQYKAYAGGDLGTDRSLLGLWKPPGRTNIYYPVTDTSFWLEVQVFGYNPAASRTINLLLHMLCAYLFYLVLLQLGVPGAYIAALLFLLHPVCVETVAWIVERKNLLAMAFSLGGILAYLRGWNPWAVFVVFILGCLAKPTAVVAPCALLVLMWWKRDGYLLHHFGKLMPIVVNGTLLALYGSHLENTQNIHGTFQLELADRATIMAFGPWFYLYKLAVPHLWIHYEGWEPDIHNAFFILLLPATAVWLYLWKRGLCAAWLIFLGALMPALGIATFYGLRFSPVADHWQYMACTAVFAVAGVVLVRTKWVKWAVLGVAALITYTHSGVFSNMETLMKDSLDHNPTHWAANNMLGAHLAMEHREAEAMPYLRRAVWYGPEERYEALVKDYAFVMMMFGHRREAIQVLRQMKLPEEDLR